MRKFFLGLLLLLLFAAIAGVGVMAFWELPAPVTTMEKSIPNDRFSQ